MVVTSQPRDADGDPMSITDEKRTAILGAMKNISLDYMPQWATVVPEEAWMDILKSDGGAKSQP